MRIFACDLSMNRPGVAVLDYDEATCVPTLLMTEAKRLDKLPAKLHGQKLAETYNWITNLMLKWKPNEFVREQAFCRFHHETKVLNKVIGITDVALWNLRDNVAPADLSSWDFRDDNRSFYEIAPVSVKKLVTGDSRASKETVANCLAQYVGTKEYKYDDESDAVAVAIAWLIKTGRPVQCRMTVPHKDASRS